ncbi:MAG: hypothetical protein LBB63_03905 [Holosporaceae bacterium]|jgi:hypothetical protein|nr:hypothetical protein [Holosporaceae bacterium]
MNTEGNAAEEAKYFSIEDVVSYSNIEITHVNDNRMPTKILMTKVAIGLVIVAMIAALFFI